LVDTRAGEVGLANDGSKRPVAQHGCGHQKWYTDEEALIRDRQIHYV